MSPKDRFRQHHITVDETTAEQLKHGTPGKYTVEALPPSTEDVPATLYRFVKGITEYETAWFGLRNHSPVTVFEIRRSTPDRIRFQFTVSSKRMERKVRTQLAERIPGIGFEEGEDGLPVEAGDSIGGGFLQTGRKDWYPLRTDFDTPPNNTVASSLHRHAMRDTKIIIQILFQPTSKKSLRDRRWTRKARNEARHLRRRYPDLRVDESATPREHRQAQKIEAKVGSTRFKTGIRILITGAGDATLSRVKEVTAGFNNFEEPDTEQYLKTRYLRTYRESRIHGFAKAVRNREFQGWAYPFQTSTNELAALLSIPDREQENIQTAPPR